LPDRKLSSRRLASFPISRHQSLKVSYTRGAYIRFGGDYDIFSAAWQYSWIDRPN
jgi:hypothetical protein